MAPLLISDSITRLFSSRRSTFSQNSKIDLEAPQFFARSHDGLNRIPAHVLHCRQPETNACSVRSEVRVGDIDIRRLDRDAHLAALVDVLHDVVSVPVTDVSSAAMNSTG